MKQGFLLSSGKEKINRKPLYPSHSDSSGGLKLGWGRSSCDVDNIDPWERPTSATIAARQPDLESKVNSLQEELLENKAKSACNPYADVLNVPFKISEVPMNALGCYYGKYYSQYLIKMSEYYFSWNDQNPKTHLLRWTSVFVCPISAEIFVTGSWLSNDPLPKYEPPSEGISLSSKDMPSVEAPNSLPAEQPCRWMKSKKAAEHGAAAWAYDCFQYRNKLKVENSESLKDISTKYIGITAPIGKEVPYLEEMAILTVPEFVPCEVKVRIEQRQEEVRKGALIRDRDVCMETEEELAWFSLKNHRKEMDEGA